MDLYTEFKQRRGTVLHRNLLLPVNDLPVDLVQDCRVQKKPQRRRRQQLNNRERTEEESNQSMDEEEFSDSLRQLPVYKRKTVRVHSPQPEPHHQLRAAAPEYQPVCQQTEFGHLPQQRAPSVRVPILAGRPLSVEAQEQPEENDTGDRRIQREPEMVVEPVSDAVGEDEPALAKVCQRGKT